MVLYIDSFTLTFIPGIKTAFVVGPAEPISMMGRVIATEQMTIYNISHAMLNNFIESGAFGRRIASLRKYCGKNRDRLCEALTPLKRHGLSFSVPEGGLCLWCKLPDDVNEKKLFALCRENKLLYMPGSVFFPYGYGGSGYIRLCFSNVREDEIDKAAAILKDAILKSKNNFERKARANLSETGSLYRL